MMAHIGWRLVGGVLGVVVALVVGAEAASVTTNIRVGVITNKDGPHLKIYFPAIAACNSVSSVAVADDSGTSFDRARNALAEKFGDLKTFRDPSAMLKEFRPNLVVVALPAHLAPNRIREALNAECHVLAEKPACVRPEDFVPLVALAEQKKLNLMLALPQRLAPSTVRAKEIIDAAWLGKPYGVVFHHVKDQARLTRSSYQKSWYADRDLAGGGHLIWLGIHKLDRVFFLLNDRVESVTAFTNNVGEQPIKIEDSEAVAFRFRSGMLGTFHGGYYVEGGSMQAGTTIWGSKGWMKMDDYRGPDGSTTLFRWYSTHEDAPRGVQTERLEEANPYFLLMQAAVDATRGAMAPPLTGGECLHVLKVIFGAYQSAEIGKATAIRD